MKENLNTDSSKCFVPKAIERIEPIISQRLHSIWVYFMSRKILIAIITFRLSNLILPFLMDSLKTPQNAALKHGQDWLQLMPTKCMMVSWQFLMMQEIHWLRKGYRQVSYIQKARVTRSCVESAKIRLKHLESGNIVSGKRFLAFKFHNLKFRKTENCNSFKKNHHFCQLIMIAYRLPTLAMDEWQLTKMISSWLIRSEKLMLAFPGLFTSMA